MQPCDRLTAKEVQVAGLVWEGQTNREIAKVIGTTEQVVKNYLRNTFDKLGVWSRLELALYVAGHGGAHWRNASESSNHAPASTSENAHSQPPTATGFSEPDVRDDHQSPRSARPAKALPGLISA